MKRIYILLGLLFSISIIAQEKASINDFNFESVTNPAFILLDETPTQLHTPENLKSLSVYLANGFSNTNIAVEVNPYWYIDFDEKRTYKKYRGFKERNGEEYIDPLIGLKTDWSFSLAYLEKEFEGFTDEKRVAGIGARTTILKFYNKARTKEVSKAITKIGVKSELSKEFELYYMLETENPKPGSGICKSYAESIELQVLFQEVAKLFIEDEENAGLLQRLSIENITPEKLVEYYLAERCPKVESFVNNPKNIKPNIRIDGAIGYSVLFKEADINAATANRFGSWLTAEAAVRFNSTSYLHIYAIGKYVDDGFNIDEEGFYFNESLWDYGGKLELELNKFKLGYEYLKRSGDEERFRSVGNISYQLNEDITITGGFGKDFPVDNNLVTILGINWGFDLGEQAFE